MVGLSIPFHYTVLPLEKGGLLRVRSPLLTESLLISFPEGTEMFHFPSFTLITYEFSNK